MNRREYISALSSLTAAQWDGEGWPDPEEWPPIGDGGIIVDDVSVSDLTTYADGTIGMWNIMPGDVDEGTVEVDYTEDYIHVGVHGVGELIETGAGFELTSDQARDLAVALYRAAEEKDRRPTEDDQ